MSSTPAPTSCIHKLSRPSTLTTPAAEPSVYPCAADHAEHSPSTAGAKGPAATRGIRTGYDRAVDDLFVTDITSRHSVPEESSRRRDYADLPNLTTADDLHQPQEHRHSSKGGIGHDRDPHWSRRPWPEAVSG